MLEKATKSRFCLGKEMNMMDKENNSGDGNNRKAQKRPRWQSILFVVVILILMGLLYEPLRDFGRDLFILSN